MPQLNTITSKQLMRLIGTPDAPAIVDVRIPDDLATHAALIPTAETMPHTALEDIVSHTKGRRSVIICHKGLKLSQGVSALLRARGQQSEALEGGMLGWLDAAYPAVPLAKLQNVDRWVTRHRPKIDRIACGWLVRRFINQNADILFVSPSEVIDVANRFNAIPFDVADVELTHRGALCTFDAMIADYGLSTPALQRLADVVRAADTNMHENAAEAAGLLAISVGLSQLHRDDTAQLDAAMPLYDALYRWARDGFAETHETTLGNNA